MNVREFVSKYNKEIVLTAVNYLPATPSLSTDIHSHFNIVHMTYVKKGYGICRVRDEVRRLVPGSVHFVMPGEIHRYSADAKNPYSIYFIHLIWYGTVPDELSRYFLVPSSDRKRFESCLKELSELFRSSRDESSEFRKYGLFSLVWADILKFSGKTESVPIKNYIPVNSPEARLNYVFEKLYGPPFQFPGIDFLAEHCMMSRRKFTAVFRKLMGMSVRQYYLRNVMTYASSMMESGELKLKDIAIQCGYSNSQNFLHAYKLSTRGK